MIRQILKDKGYHIDRMDSEYHFTVYLHGNRKATLTRESKRDDWQLGIDHRVTRDNLDKFFKNKG